MIIMIMIAKAFNGSISRLLRPIFGPRASSESLAQLGPQGRIPGVRRSGGMADAQASEAEAIGIALGFEGTVSKTGYLVKRAKKGGGLDQAFRKLPYAGMPAEEALRDCLQPRPRARLGL